MRNFLIALIAYSAQQCRRVDGKYAAGTIKLGPYDSELISKFVFDYKFGCEHKTCDVKDKPGRLDAQYYILTYIQVKRNTKN